MDGRRVKVGEIGVDAGCVWIVDPCYVLDEDGSGPAKWQKGWDAHCKAMEAAGFFGENRHGIEFESGVVVSSGFGDGKYPVYAELSDEGSWGTRVKRLIVEFISDEDEVDEVEYEDDEDD